MPKPKKEPTPDPFAGLKCHLDFSPYGKGIVEACGCTPADTFQVEELMRDKFSTLDGLTKWEFDACARKMWKAVQILRVSDPDLFPTPAKKE